MLKPIDPVLKPIDCFSNRMSEISKPIDPILKSIDCFSNRMFEILKPIDRVQKPIDPLTFITNDNVRILQKSTDSFTFNALQRLQSGLSIISFTNNIQIKRH